MKHVEIPISDATKRILDQWNLSGTCKGARRSKLSEPGDWMIELSASTLEQLERTMLPGESYDDVIARIHNIVKGLN